MERSDFEAAVFTVMQEHVGDHTGTITDVHLMDLVRRYTELVLWFYPVVSPLNEAKVKMAPGVLDWIERVCSESMME